MLQGRRTKKETNGVVDGIQVNGKGVPDQISG